MMSVALATLLILTATPTASADERGAPVESLEAMRSACLRARDQGPPALYSVLLGSGQWTFGTYLHEDEFLPLDTRRNLRIFEGAAEILPSGLETIGLAVAEDRAEALRDAHRAGARLRL